MIVRERDNCLTSIGGHDSSAITCVGYITHIVDYQSDYRTRAGLVNFTSSYLLGFSVLKEKSFTLMKAISDSFERVLREIFVFYYLKI